MANAQNAINGGISVSEYRQRRERVLNSLKGAVAIVFAGDGPAPYIGKWRADANFRYLTGLENEPAAAVLFDPNAENPKRRCILFLRPLNPEQERWDGYRDTINSALKSRTGFETIFRTNVLPGALTAATRRAKRLACLHPFAVYPAPVSADLAAFRQVAERIPGVQIEDQTNLLSAMRAVKSPVELALMKQAVGATAAGYVAAMGVIRPGATEEQVAFALESGYREHGARGVAYNSIVGSGLNSTVLHYIENSQVLNKGDLLVIDSAADYAGYAADVTRTYPVGGHFTSEQRDLYEIVLKAQLAAIKTARAGTHMITVEQAARNVIEKAGFGDAFIHGAGHQLGLDVHDATPDGALKAGMVVTIEPGIYFPDRKMGVRIEDDVLITRSGPQVLTAMIPKKAADVEAALAGGR